MTVTMSWTLLFQLAQRGGRGSVSNSAKKTTAPTPGANRGRAANRGRGSSAGRGSNNTGGNTNFAELYAEVMLGDNSDTEVSYERNAPASQPASQQNAVERKELDDARVMNARLLAELDGKHVYPSYACD